MQKSGKKNNHEKKCDIGTDHQCKVKNIQQCRQVPKQDKVRECNLVNNPVCNDIHSEEVISMQCKEILKEKGWDEPKQPYKQLPREKVGINLLNYTRIITRWCARIFQRKNLGTSLDKNDMMNQEKSNMRFSEGILTMYLYKNANLSMSLYAALHTMNPTVMLQDRFLYWFLDRNATVNQERSAIRFQRRSTTVYLGSNVLK